MFPCVSGTALGAPVVPEVYMRSARSSAPAGGGASLNSFGVGVSAQSSKRARPSGRINGRKATAGILLPISSHAARNFSTDAGETNASFASEPFRRSEEHTSELQSQSNLVCRLLL